MNDIKLMITLSGSKRLPHLEADIFKDAELTCYYLNAICKDLDWYYTCNAKDDCSIAAYRYAVHVIKGRWLEAEAVINSAETGKFWYTRFMVVVGCTSL